MDSALDLFRTNATTLCLAGVLPYVLLAIYVVVMRHYVVPGNILADYQHEIMRALQHMDTDQLWHVLVDNTPCFNFLLGYYGALWIAVILSYAVQCRVAIARALGQPLALGRAYQHAGGASWRLLIFSLFYALIAGTVFGVAMIVLMVPIGMLAGNTSTFFGIMVAIMVAIVVLGAEAAVILLTVYFLALPIALVNERQGFFAALSRGNRIATSNYKPHAWAFYLISRLPLVILPLLIAVGALIWEGLRYLPASVPLQIVESMVSIAAMVILTGIFAALQALVYLDGCCRVDAFDLQLLAQNIGLEVDAGQMVRAKLPARTRRNAVTPLTMPNYAASPLPEPPPAPEALPSPVLAFPDYSAPPPPLEVPMAATAEPLEPTNPPDPTDPADPTNSTDPSAQPSSESEVQDAV